MLIVLAKARLLGLLHITYGSALMGPVVYFETVKEGRRIGAHEVQRIESAVTEGWLVRVHTTSQEQRFAARLEQQSQLGPGECEAISLAKHRGQTLIVDDKGARMTAEGLGLDYTGTVGIVLEAFRNGLLSRDEAEEAVARVSRHMWLSPAVITTVLRMLKGDVQ
ncbi:MAG: hypothetical protein HY820_20370 [Acidobacteria bacterium]|nr:hypothetical protein [Acidobacteriota bacterium]